jgi:hypothetical protein
MLKKAMYRESTIPDTRRAIILLRLQVSAVAPIPVFTALSKLFDHQG